MKQIEHRGMKVFVNDEEPPKTMTMLQPDGSFREEPYTERRTGVLNDIPDGTTTMIPNYELARAIRNNAMSFMMTTVSGTRTLKADALALWLQEYVTITPEGEVSIREKGDKRKCVTS